jgi:hypothetical protein
MNSRNNTSAVSIPYNLLPSNPVPRNSEKNSEISELDGEIAEFCPKSANLISGTGDNSEITVKLRAGPS